MSATSTAVEHANDQTWWYNHIKNWEAQECSAADYCRQHQLSEQAFTRWKSRYLKERKNGEILSVDFLPVLTEESRAAAPSPSPSSGSDTIQIHLPNGISLQVGHSGGALADLVKQLVSLPC